MRLISGCLQPTQLSWLPVLSNVAPPSLHRKAATGNTLQIIEAAPNWPMYANVFQHPPPRLASRCPMWSDMTSVDTICSGERTGRRLLWSTTLLLPTLLSDSQVSISLVIRGLWWTVSGQVKAHVVLTCTNGVSSNHFLVIVASDRPWPHCWHVPVNKIWRRTESTPQRGVIWLESTATAALTY